ncbi:MAG: diguanylate cyclase [Lachnospiraceae bacterium]|nr:diguanylate cyclase [Lachnospiraceae bacterium]
MKRIIAVDDNVTNLKMVERVLKDKYKLVLVKSGEKALTYLENNLVDLILLDIVMPEMDGFQVFENIKQLDNSNNSVPVVFLTADTEVGSEVKGLNMGAMDFIKKPFIPEVMLNRIENILELSELMKDLEHKVQEKTRQIEQISFETIATIASMIEAKDSYTKGHSVRVSEYSARLAKELGWSEDKIGNLRYVALLHDIGKVGIPDSVLNKPGKLNEIEFSVIKSHTSIGGDILNDIKTIAGVSLGAKYHHERYDGKGYPTGVAGEDIPEIARIICIADAYDAMNSKRIYRDNLSKDEIYSQLENGKGTQFDPKFTDLFLKLLDEDKLVIEDEDELEKAELTLTEESSILLNQIVNNIEENQKSDIYDILTGVLNRKTGESRIAEAVRTRPGCLVFVDLDNLKKTNDSMGHLAGDYVLKNLGTILLKYGDKTIVSRVGGDEFLCYIPEVEEKEAVNMVESIIKEFDFIKKDNEYLKYSSLSVGMYMSSGKELFADAVTNADKALYHIKHSGKAGYCMYSEIEGMQNKKTSIDLNNMVKSLKANRTSHGAINVEFDEFKKIYDFVLNIVHRFDHNLQLIMLTLEPIDYNNFDIEEQEYAMYCMKKAIKGALRNIDVSTRFSSEQFLVILLNATDKDVDMILKRIHEKFDKEYKRNEVNVSYDIADLNDK